LKQEIDDLSSALSKAETEYAHLNDWHAYFARLKEELESVRRRSLKNYIEKYGPLTSSIQKRLRSVYGFGDLKLQQERSGIALRVERKGHKDLPPSDYFSEAQLQIVTLSMFLSAVLTQTWSSFAPILLDDPVTHFDDLNAYSFLDVIRGLIDEPGKGPQFILSTCEERLYRLMRQKFAQLNGQAIFYEFSSIGEDGPKVERHSN
jgi:exonuclease SbcC